MNCEFFDIKNGDTAAGSKIMISRRIWILTDSSEKTRELGEKIGLQLTGGTVLALIGALGSGKTCFVQGLAKGLEVPEDYYITSPTYTLINEYPGRHSLFHADLYRIEGCINYDETGLDEIICGDGVVALEWADRLDEDLLTEHITIYFEILDDNLRRITITAHGVKMINIVSKIESQIEREK